MTRRLLDRQVRLLEYLTSGDAIFRGNRQAPIDPALQGIDRGMLHLEARFSHEKRMEKIAAVFPVTFDLIGAGLDGIVRGFVDACPPLDISRIENARQFYDFLTARWQREPPAPRYLPDVAAFELACAQVRVASDTGEPATVPVDTARAGIRRKPGVVLLRAAYDIRAIFENGRGATAPIERETPLAITLASGEPQIFELTPEIFDLLSALERWVAIDELPGADELIASLADAGMLELSR
jgi:hypothetical protein